MEEFEKKKIYLEFIKFKITLFTTILGAGVYLLINRVTIVKFINEDFFNVILWALIMYGVVGFFSNVFEFNKKLKEFKK